MLSRDFSFEFPPELIAQEPLSERDASRMMVVDRKSDSFQSTSFRDLASYFQRGDLLLLNNTKVIPARLQAKKKTGGKVEVLLVKRSPSEEGERWECLIRSMKGLKEGHEILFAEEDRTIPALLRIEEEKKFLQFPSGVEVLDLMRKAGAAPLPPYIKRPEPRSADLSRYQTVFAKKEGAIAAPTAALHFTPALLKKLEDAGVRIRALTLHVGLGTFQPLQTERVEDHRMQTEFYEIPQETLEAVRSAKEEGRPITAVGTTTVRAIESYFSSENPPFPRGGFHSTNLFITPGYRFKIVDRLLTNFHQPESTPLLLTCAFAGKDLLFRAYREAIQKKYRLFSYGDCMFIL